MKIDSKTSIYCIFGNPVKHSLSPIIHNSAFKEMKINSVYTAFEPDSIEDAIFAMRVLNIKGASVTIPFKIDAIKYVDKLDPLAEKIGSINTLVNSDGVITGYNTDGIGALLSLEQNNVKIKNSNFLVIGNGGSARSIAFTLLEKQASVCIAGRNINRVGKLINDLKTYSDRVESTLIKDLDNNFMDKIDVIINTTSVGMAPDIDSSPVEKDLINRSHTVFDIVYSPEITSLLDFSLEKGCSIIKGIEMLINQGIKQFELWTGMEAPSSVIHKNIIAIIYGNR